MTPQDALIELLARVGARNAAAVFVSAEELNQWPLAAVAAMKSQKLLTKTRPAKSVVCPGCEQACPMPVHTLPAGARGSASFIVCDKRSDINRVAISADLLTQWRCNAEDVCGVVAKSLGIRRSEQRSDNGAVWNIGMARGDKRSQMLCLQADGEIALVVGNTAIPLAEMVGFRDGEYLVDAAMIRQLVDAATTADSRYTPSNVGREARKLETQAMYEQWQKAYRTLKKQHPRMTDVWFAQRIAKIESGPHRNYDTIRKHMKK